MTDVMSFEIHGLNGRKAPLSYNLDRYVNVFFGPNGSGKTSILKILHSAMSNEPGLLSTIALHSAKVRIHSVRYQTRFSLRYAKSDEDKSTEAANLTDDVDRSPPASSRRGQVEQWKITPRPQREVSTRVPHRWRHTYLPTTRLYMDGRSALTSRQALFDDMLVRGAGADISAAEDALDKNFADSLQRLWSTRYGDILKGVGQIQQEALQSIFLDVLAPNTEAPVTQAIAREAAPILEADRAFERMSSFLQRQAFTPGLISESDARIRQVLSSGELFTERYNNDPRLRQIVSRIDAVEAEIEQAMKPIEQLSNLVRRLFLKGKALSFEGPRITVKTDTDSEIGLEKLSSGEKHLLRILVAALGAEESSMLIDEPEISMHIDWQRELVDNIQLLNPNCQLILATHSPEIMAEISDDNIFRV